MGEMRLARDQQAISRRAKPWLNESDRVDRPLVREGQPTEPTEPNASGPNPSEMKPAEDPSGDPARGQAPLVSIPAGCSFEGMLAFEGETILDGQLVGEVVARGTLRLGVTARVRARIEVDELIVAGELVGDVVARRRIELLPTARVQGSIETPRFSVAEGSVFQGRCRCIP